MFCWGSPAWFAAAKLLASAYLFCFLDCACCFSAPSKIQNPATPWSFTPWCWSWLRRCSWLVNRGLSPFFTRFYLNIPIPSLQNTRHHHVFAWGCGLTTLSKTKLDTHAVRRGGKCMKSCWGHRVRFCFTRWLIAVNCLLLLMGSLAFSQSSNTSLSGTVKDSQGGVIASATVVLTNVSTATARTQKTGAEGRYSFDLLTPGDYRLEVQAPGFRKQTLAGLHVLIAQANTVEVTMQVGAVNEEVTVSAESTQVTVDTQDASLGNNFMSQQITQLPLEARNVLSLLTLQPAVTKDGYVAGGRADQSNVTLDGVDINEAYSNAIGPAQTDITVPNAEKGPVLRLNSEAIEEFRVSTLNSGAGGGRSSGAQIALVTKSGSNTWHGAAFESNRNTIFTANDWFNNHAGIARPTLIRNTFGGAVGGPVIRNKMFFFYSYEGRTDASQTPVLAANQSPVPMTSMGQGLLKFHLCSGSKGSYDCSNPGQMVTLGALDFAKIFPDIQGLDQAGLQTL